MTIERITDLKYVKNFLTQDGLFDLISGGESMDDFYPDENDIFLSADGKGIYIVNKQSDKYFLHANFPPKNWGRNDNYTKEVLAWINGNLNIKKIYAKINKKHKKVISHALRTGFVLDAIDNDVHKMHYDLG